jgi:hypothetical protein
MSLNEAKDIMVNIIWANQYTKYLKNEKVVMMPIDNNQLMLQQQEMDNVLVEDEDYVIIYFSINPLWTIVIK